MISTTFGSRAGYGTAVTLLTMALAVVGALLTRSEIGQINTAVESAAATSGTWVGEIAVALPFGYAFGAGMVAAMNPCGFALLPAYLGLYLGSGNGPGSRRRSLGHFWQALSVSSTMTAGFILVFGVAGLVLSVAASAAARYLPWMGLAVGILLVVVGGRMLGGATIYTNIGDRMADRFGADAQRRSLRGYFAYGLAYATASLSCTLPIFLAVVAGALAAGGFLSATSQLLLYALGMGTVVALLTLSTAFFKAPAIARARKVVRYVQPASAVLLLVAGAYVVYYWLTLGGLLAAWGLAGR